MSYSSQVVSQGQALLSSSRRPVGGGIKRAFDFAAACVAIITLLPLFLACCAADSRNITWTDFVLSPTTWFRRSRILLSKIPHHAG